MSASIGIRIDLVRRSEYDENGFLGFQYDGFGEQASGVPAIEAMHVHGFVSRPLDPEVDSGGNLLHGCQMLRIGEGDKAFALAMHDARPIPGLPELEPGEAAVYGPAHNFERWHIDGRISRMCTTDGTADGQMVSEVQGPDGWSWVGPWAQLRHDGLGIHYQHVSGATFDVGGISGLPGPLASLGSYAILSAAIISLKGTTVQLGVGSFQPAAKALVTLSVLAAQAAADTAQAVANTSVAAALAALAAIPLNAAAAPACAAAVTALSAATAAQSSAVSAIAAAATTLPAQTVQIA